MSRRDDIRKIINSYYSRLRALKQQQAVLGISTPPAVLIEIENTEAEIAKLQAGLGAEKDYNLAVVRELLATALSDEELTTLAYDHFRSVYESFAGGMSKSAKTQHLLEYCERHALVPNLLMQIRQYNPNRYFEFDGRLFSEEPTFANTDARIEQLGPPDRVHEPLNNPYVVGNPIQPDNTRVFSGRFDIAQSIANEIKRGGQKPSILLYGRRRMGKTSAILNIGRLMRDRSVLLVYVSGQSAKFHTNTDFCYYLVQAINKSLQNSLDTEAFQQMGYLAKAKFMPNPILTLSEFFEKCNELLESQGKYCLLSVDEYEEIDRCVNTSPGNHHEQNITRELLIELRDTLQHRPRFMFLFAGTHFLKELSTVNWSEIFINVKTLHISFLKREDGYRLLTEPVPELEYENANLIQQILDMTGCQPFLIQAVASELIYTLNSNDTKTATRTLLDKATDSVLSKLGTYFDYIWETECVSSKHQDLLKFIVTAPSGVLEVNLATYQKELRDLVRREVLKIEGGMVKFTMPMVKLWMKKNQHIL